MSPEALALLKDAGPYGLALLLLAALKWLNSDRATRIAILERALGAALLDATELRNQRADDLQASTRENMSLAQTLTDLVKADGASAATQRQEIVGKLDVVLERLPPR